MRIPIRLEIDGKFWIDTEDTAVQHIKAAVTQIYDRIRAGELDVNNLLEIKNPDECDVRLNIGITLPSEGGPTPPVDSEIAEEPSDGA